MGFPERAAMSLCVALDNLYRPLQIHALLEQCSGRLAHMNHIHKFRGHLTSWGLCPGDTSSGPHMGGEGKPGIAQTHVH